MPPLSRRALLGTLATATAIAVAGWASDKQFPDDDAGPDTSNCATAAATPTSSTSP